MRDIRVINVEQLQKKKKQKLWSDAAVLEFRFHVTIQFRPESTIYKGEIKLKKE